MIKQVIWASMVDYPGKICSVLFNGNCNFNCDYCYNRKLLKFKDINFNDILNKLIDRKDMIDSVILSGGECTVESEFNKIIDLLYSNNFNIGIHTNGLNSDVIINNIDKIDYIGLDYKTSDGKYNDLTKTNVNISNIEKVIKLLVDKNKNYEIRTTVYPKYVTLEDCLEIANKLKKLNVKKYYLQKYIQTEDTPNIKPYNISYIENIQIQCNKILPTILK
ncbi:MAG: anaerobic ribonucleoside-triphosphate reductase activating protein [Clostridia bacterium]